MGDVTSVDSAQLKAQGPKFTAVAQQLDTAIQKLNSSIKTEGECWGHDDPGKSFASGYASDLDQDLKHLSDLVTILHSVGDTIVSNANSLQQQDDANSSSYQGLV